MTPTTKRVNSAAGFVTYCLVGGVISVATGVSVSNAAGGGTLGHVAFVIVASSIACVMGWFRPQISAWPGRWWRFRLLLFREDSAQDTDPTA